MKVTEYIKRYVSIDIETKDYIVLNKGYNVKELDKRFIDKYKVLKLINIDIFNMFDINMRDKLGQAKNKTEINNILSDYLKELKNNNKILKLLEE